MEAKVRAGHCALQDTGLASTCTCQVAKKMQHARSSVDCIIGDHMDGFINMSSSSDSQCEMYAQGFVQSNDH